MMAAMAAAAAMLGAALAAAQGYGYDPYYPGAGPYGYGRSYYPRGYMGDNKWCLLPRRNARRHRALLLPPAIVECHGDDPWLPPRAAASSTPTTRWSGIRATPTPAHAAADRPSCGQRKSAARQHAAAGRADDPLYLAYHDHRMGCAGP
ncbi:MAG: hypothetical protein MZW92_08030 [Comamonadaceae bacterium]|nr:hypothetical protein [Comamonadaceae bacterium]